MAVGGIGLLASQGNHRQKALCAFCDKQI